MCQNAQKMQNMIDKLEVKIPVRDMLTRDWRAKLQAIMGNFMPLAPAVLGAYFSMYLCLRFILSVLFGREQILPFLFVD
jgi:hypothetical protein